jgi:hypothetical protein
MNARAYFSLMDAIAAARTANEIETMQARVASTDMHPFERLALERQLRARALAMELAFDFEQQPFPDPPDRGC